MPKPGNKIFLSTLAPFSSPAQSQSVPALTSSLLTGSSVQLEEVRKKRRIAVWEGEPIATLCEAKLKAVEKPKKKGAKIEKGKKEKEK